MSYATEESSAENGNPVELYNFVYSGQSFFLTSSDTPIDHLGHTFTPTAIQRPKIEDSSNVDKANLEITVSKDSPVAAIFADGPPSEVVFVTVWSTHVTDTDAQFVVAWKGRVIDCNWEPDSATLTTENVFSSLLRSGLGPRFSVQCTVPLYSMACGIAKESRKVTTTITAISGLNITVDLAGENPDNWFGGGLLSWTNSVFGNTEWRAIRSSDKATGVITLPTHAPGLAAGQTVDVYPGCDHSLGTCDSKFNNAVNYRGHPYIPVINPFGGNAIF